MFTHARLKLTTWYLLIIMTVSISFSAFIYRGISLEFERRLNVIANRLELRQLGYFPQPGQVQLFIQDLEDAKEKVFWILVYTNLVILVFSGVAGYFLAGKTLQPIELALNEQKRFVADASHEFKTPLTSLQTSIEVGLRDKKLSLSEAKALLKDSLKDIENLSSLSNYLLGLAKYQRSNNLPRENVKMKDVIENVIMKVNPIAKARKITILKDIADFSLKANKENLEKLITILLDNSLKYSFNNKSIKVSAFKQKGDSIIEVKDEGIGISTADIPHLFERFYRADISRSKDQVDGFGLGLSMAKQIVDSYHGEIKVKSELGKGSSFKVILPI